MKEETDELREYAEYLASIMFDDEYEPFAAIEAVDVESEGSSNR